MAYVRKTERERMCPLEYGLELFGGKWKSRILCVLSFRGTLRYGELKEELGNITDAVLASMLKELVADDMVLRKSYDEIPPRVEYSLSLGGESVLPILQGICQWSRDHSSEDLETKLPSCRNCPHL